jgi:hypothetical protein
MASEVVWGTEFGMRTEPVSDATQVLANGFLWWGSHLKWNCAVVVKEIIMRFVQSLCLRL